MQMTEKILHLISEYTHQLNGQDRLEFDEVAIYFTKEEWDGLSEEQKKLYKDVMMENYQSLRSLGCVHAKPLIVSMIEQEEEPFIRGQQQSNERESPVNFRTDGFICRNPPEAHFIPRGMIDCVTKYNLVNQNYLDSNHMCRNSPSKSPKESVKMIPKELNL
ncbi:zinc finger protein 713-like, partial [Rhinophrynus dorsalis]